MGEMCPLKTFSHVPFSKFHCLAVASPLPESNLLPSIWRQVTYEVLYTYIYSCFVSIHTSCFVCTYNSYCPMSLVLIREEFKSYTRMRLSLPAVTKISSFSMAAYTLPLWWLKDSLQSPVSSLQILTVPSPLALMIRFPAGLRIWVLK